MFISDLIGATTIFGIGLSRAKVWIKVCNLQFEPDWSIKKAEPKLRMVFGKGKVQRQETVPPALHRCTCQSERSVLSAFCGRFLPVLLDLGTNQGACFRCRKGFFSPIGCRRTTPFHSPLHFRANPKLSFYRS